MGENRTLTTLMSQTYLLQDWGRESVAVHVAKIAQCRKGIAEWSSRGMAAMH
jgi:hypothetical protein